MNKRIQQLKALSLEEWWLLLVAMVLLPVVAISLRMRGFKHTQNSIRRFIPDISNLREPGEIEMEKARIIARMVTVAAGHGAYRANCLKQSLVIWWLLGRRRIKSQIVFGVPKEAVENFNAHAWVECNGINLSDSNEVQQKFTSFTRSKELSTED